MEITRAGSQASAKGPGDWFTGPVRIDPLFQACEPDIVRKADTLYKKPGYTM